MIAAAAEAAPSPASVPLTGGAAGIVALPFPGGPVPNVIVPPGGFVGFAQQTPATQALFQRAGRIGGKRSAAKRRRKRKSSKKKAAPAARRRRRRSTKRRLVKGSAAAKRYMARLRRMRKRRK